MSVRVGWYAVTDTIVISDEGGGEAEFPRAEWEEFLDAVRKSKPGEMSKPGGEPWRGGGISRPLSPA